VTLIRILAFGASSGETWGVGWMPQGTDPSRLAVRLGSSEAVVDASLELEDEGPWRLEGEGCSLLLAPTGPAITSHDSDGQLERRDQLCEVSGRIQVEGQEAEISCLGWAGEVQSESALDKPDSVRFLAGWLEPENGFSLIAVRPRRARDHEGDLVAAGVVDQPTARVVDPRLSTTYREQGAPARAGVELWLEPEEAENAGEETSLQYPRRAVGEAGQPGLDWEQGKLKLHASLMHWHSRGREGPGVYLLGRRR
jgi:hypothetical protein